MIAREEFLADCRDLFYRTKGNDVSIPGKGETTLYDMPLIGFASASDEIFHMFRDKEVIGPYFFGPCEWLPSAKTVVSFFLPFSEKVRVSNREDKVEASLEWQYARVEGQEFIGKYMTALKQALEEKGIEVCVPSLDERFGMEIDMVSTHGKPDFHVESRWSERHAAYACGLGTFGLSRGLITEKGMAGRYASLIVSADWEATERLYTGIDDYCVKCGACVKKCPAQAITLEAGKNNLRCKAYVDKTKEKYAPRYGCGKCQVGVPCENRAPGRKRG